MDNLGHEKCANNAKAVHTLYCTLDMNEFIRISRCEIAKEIWDKLEVTH